MELNLIPLRLELFEPFSVHDFPAFWVLEAVICIKFIRKHCHAKIMQRTHTLFVLNVRVGMFLDDKLLQVLRSPLIELLQC